LSVVYRVVQQDEEEFRPTPTSGANTCSEAETVGPDSAGDAGLLQTLPLELESGSGITVYVRVTSEGVSVPEDVFSNTVVASVPPPVLLRLRDKIREHRAVSIPLFVVLDFRRSCAS
jgi:hypothetical protein